MVKGWIVNINSGGGVPLLCEQTEIDKYFVFADSLGRSVKRWTIFNPFAFI